jgi:hypothetical protein
MLNWSYIIPELHAFFMFVIVNNKTIRFGSEPVKPTLMLHRLYFSKSFGFNSIITQHKCMNNKTYFSFTFSMLVSGVNGQCQILVGSDFFIVGCCKCVTYCC